MKLIIPSITLKRVWMSTEVNYKKLMSRKSNKTSTLLEPSWPRTLPSLILLDLRKPSKRPRMLPWKSERLCTPTKELNNNNNHLNNNNNNKVLSNQVKTTTTNNNEKTFPPNSNLSTWVEKVNLFLLLFLIIIIKKKKSYLNLKFDL